jgi:Domain of unknown function (DUF4177)
MSMIKIRCPHCDEGLEAPESYAGRKARCKSCGESFVIAIERAAPQITLPSPVSSPPRVDRNEPVESAKDETPFEPKQYKVLSQKDKWFSGKFDPEQLEKALNSYADQGWVLKAAVTASIAGFGGNREELVMILER